MFIYFFRLLQSASLSLGTMAEITLRAIDINRLPALVLFTRNRSNTEILSVINGNVMFHHLSFFSIIFNLNYHNTNFNFYRRLQYK